VEVRGFGSVSGDGVVGQGASVRVERSQPGNSLSGSFQLGHINYKLDVNSWTSNLAFDEPASSLAANLNQLEGLSGVTATRSGPDDAGGYEWTVTFSGGSYTRSLGDLPLLAYSDYSLVDFYDTAAIEIFEVVPGHAPEVQEIATRSRSKIDGYWYVSYLGKRSGPLNALATSLQVQNAIEALPSVGTVRVSREPLEVSDPHPNYECTWSVTFLQLADDVPLLEVWKTDEGGTPTLHNENGDVVDIMSLEVVNGHFRPVYGEFSLIIDGGETAQIPFDASGEVVKEAIEDVGAGDVEVVRLGPNINGGYRWQVTFLESSTNEEGLRTISANSSSLNPFTEVSGLFQGNEATLTYMSTANLFEVQKITLLRSEGSAACSLDGLTPVDFSLQVTDSASDLEALLQEFDAIGEVQVEKAESANTVDWSVTFLQNTGNLPEFDCSKGAVSTVSDSTSISLSGHFQIKYGGESTGPIPVDASSADVKAELVQLSEFDESSIFVEDSGAGLNGAMAWTVSFRGTQGIGDKPPLLVVDTLLQGSNVHVEVIEEKKGTDLAGFVDLVMGNYTYQKVSIVLGKEEIVQLLSQNDMVDACCVDVVVESETGIQGDDIVHSIVWTLSFAQYGPAGKARHAGNLPPMEVREVDIFGSNQIVTVETLQNGSSPISGHFDLSFPMGKYKASVPHDASSEFVKIALMDLASAEADRVKLEAATESLQGSELGTYFADLAKYRLEIDVERQPVADAGGFSWMITFPKWKFPDDENLFPLRSPTVQRLDPLDYHPREDITDYLATPTHAYELLTTSITPLSGGSVSVSEVQRGTVPIGGYFQLQVTLPQQQSGLLDATFVTQPIDFHAPTLAVKNELEKYMGLDTVVVSQSPLVVPGVSPSPALTKEERWSHCVPWTSVQKRRMVMREDHPDFGYSRGKHHIQQDNWLTMDERILLEPHHRGYTLERDGEWLARIHDVMRGLAEYTHTEMDAPILLHTDEGLVNAKQALSVLDASLLCVEPCLALGQLEVPNCDCGWVEKNHTTRPRCDSWSAPESNNARVWRVTFTSLQYTGDVPDMQAESFLSGSNASVVVTENAPGWSVDVQKITFKVPESLAESDYFQLSLDREEVDGEAVAPLVTEPIPYSCNETDVEVALNNLHDDPFFGDAKVTRQDGEGNVDGEYGFSLFVLLTSSVDLSTLLDVVTNAPEPLVIETSTSIVHASNAYPLNGTFALSFRELCFSTDINMECIPAKSPDISVNATADDMTRALEAIPTQDGHYLNVTVHREGPFSVLGDYEWAVTFANQLYLPDGGWGFDPEEVGDVPEMIPYVMAEFSNGRNGCPTPITHQEWWVDNRGYTAWECEFGDHCKSIDTVEQLVPSVLNYDLRESIAEHVYQTSLFDTRLSYDVAYSVGVAEQLSNQSFASYDPTLSSLATAITINDAPCVTVTEEREGVPFSAGKVAVEVSMNSGQDYSASGILFHYLQVIEVEDAVPNHGPVYGGTEVIVAGKNFQNSSSLYCRFGEDANAVVPAVNFINSTHIVCITPPTVTPRIVLLDVSNNGKSQAANFSSSGISFAYDELVVIGEVFPLLGPSSGNFTVAVRGAGFLNPCENYGNELVPVDNRIAAPLPRCHELKCRFGAVVTQALYMHENLIECFSPPHSAGLFNLEVSNNDQDYTQFETPFYFYPDPTIRVISPVNGPAVQGGTLVTITGTGFVNTTSLSCRFGTSVATATFLSSSTIQCPTPSFDAASLGWYALNEHRTRHEDPRTGSRLLFPDAHYYPLYLSKLVSVEVSNNAQDFTDSGVTFLYQKDAVVDSVSPPSGQDTASTPLFVVGKFFVNSTTLKCKIGNGVVDATYLTSQLVMCFSHKDSVLQPSHGYLSHGRVRQLNFGHAPTHPPPKGRGSLFVEVSNNALDYTKNRTLFQYKGPCPTGSYCPTFDKASEFHCPRGTHCPGSGNTNFTLCVPGTYQPLQGQADCLRCPIGYICPESGLHIPQLCPAGFVCDVTGSIFAEQPCPAGHFCLEGTSTTATTCGHPRPSSRMFPTLSHAQRSTTLLSDREPVGHELVLGARNAACWNNATADFGLQVSDDPARFWMERHLLPLDPESPFTPIRGRYCLDGACMRLEDEADMTMSDYAFDYSSTQFALRRPVPCPVGMYCHPGTAGNSAVMKNFTSPQPCFESMYCMEGSVDPLGQGDCPKGSYCPFGVRLNCPVGTYCPRDGHWDPLPCPPGTFNAMVGQTDCTYCPAGFLCPGFGRVDPALCPAGFVCSKERLFSPNIRCPKGFYCLNGTMSSDPFRNDTTLRPYPCQPGSYCIGGVASDEIVAGDFSHAQPCTEGFYCELGSTSSKGSGLCPRGFICPQGTAVPIPTAKGQFAELEGTVQAADCLPGFYAPTIETVMCYPCPPGTECLSDGTAVATICPPGTFRSTVEADGVPCFPCPQGTWSKNWELRESAECISCPTGIVCPVDGMTNPCSRDDLPQLFEPTNNGESLVQCLGQGTSNYFGKLLPPWIDSKGRGPHFVPTSEASGGECYTNSQPHGSVVYQRYADYYGPMHEITTGKPHQGYGDAFQSPFPDFFGRGSLYIDLPKNRMYDPSNNCTRGFFLFNDTIGTDEWLPGTCEADIFCYNTDKSEAQSCPEGYVCDEKTSGLISQHPCREGYVCDFGTTPDVSLEAPRGQYAQLCPASKYCETGTGENQKDRSSCPIGYFCPTGTANPFTGAMADDALNRGLSVEHANPFLNLTNIKYISEDDIRLVSDHDQRCFDGIDPALQRNWFIEPVPYRRWGTGQEVDQKLTNRAIKQDLLCARDHKWRLVGDAISRLECDCTRQVEAVLLVYRLWKCTSEADLEFLSFSSIQDEFGGIDFWRERVHKSTNQCRFEDPWMYGMHLPPLYQHNKYNPGVVDFGETRYNSDGEAVLTVPLEVQYVWAITPGLVRDKPVLPEKLEIGNNGTGLFYNYRELKDAVTAEYDMEKADPGKNFIDPYIFDLYSAVRIVEEFGERTPEEVQFTRLYSQGDFDLQALITEWDWPEIGGTIARMPYRLDMCDCQNLLKCPNGTTTATSGADDIRDCTRSSEFDEVLGRVVPLPSDGNFTHRLVNATAYWELIGTDEVAPIESESLSAIASGGLGHVELRAMEVMVVTMNLTNIATNFTYNDHYRLAVYVDCKPCPPRYQCVDSQQCGFPSFARQEEQFVDCLAREGNADETGYVVDMDPDKTCLKTPYFCEDQVFSGDFEKLNGGKHEGECVDSTEGGCQLDDLWWRYMSFTEDEYVRPGCCSCLPSPMPPFFNIGQRIKHKGFPDNKHTILQTSITVARDAEITVALELMHGLYYGEFNQLLELEGHTEFGPIFYLYIHTPQRAEFSPILGAFVGDKTPRYVDEPFDREDEVWEKYSFVKPERDSKAFFAFVNEATLTVANPLNLPPTDAPIEEWVSLQAGILIDRVSDWKVGDPTIEVRRTSRKAVRLGPTNSSLLNATAFPTMYPTFVEDGGSRRRLNALDDFYDEDPRQRANSGRQLLQTSSGDGLTGQAFFEEGPTYAPTVLNVTIQLQKEKMKVNSYDFLDGYLYPPPEEVASWKECEFEFGENGPQSAVCSVKEEMKPIPKISERYSQLTELALPYLPFFSNCRGYGRHIPISKLFEEHPACVPLQTQASYEQRVLKDDFTTEIQKSVDQWKLFGFFETGHPRKNGPDECRRPREGELVREEQIAFQLWLNRLNLNPRRLYTSAPTGYNSTLNIESLQDALLGSTFDIGPPPGECVGPQEEYSALVPPEQSGEQCSMGINIYCQYEEDVTNEAQTFWFELDEGELFSMTKEPFHRSELEEYYTPAEDVEELFENGLLRPGIDDRMKVEIDARFPGEKDMVPTIVYFHVEYYQRLFSKYLLLRGSDIPYADEKTLEHTMSKRLVRGFIGFDGFVPKSDPALDGVGQVPYVLQFRFVALDWWQLFNTFEFELQVYVIFFLIIGLLTIFIAFVCWATNRLLTKLRHPPPFRGMPFYWLISIPPVKGVFYALIPSFTGWSVIMLLYEYELFLDEDDGFEERSKGRVGTALLIIGLYTVFLGSAMFIPDHFNEQAGDDARQEEAEADDWEEEDENKVPQSRFWAPMLWKRSHMILSSFVLAISLVTTWEFSYSAIYENSVYECIIVFKIIQMFMDQILGDIMREQLLISPFMVVIEVTEILVTMGASNFMDFTMSYIAELCVAILERLYLDPWLKDAGKLMPRWQMIIKRRFSKKRRITREQKAKEEAEWRRINEAIELESEGVEPLLDSYGVYSNEATALLLTPFINIFLWMFFVQTQMAENYNIGEGPLLENYTIFAFVIIPFTFFSDVLLLNAQELIHGWKLFDYVSYQAHRFSVREDRWQMRLTIVDESIAEPLQTLDMMCFSSQYYFMSALHAMGMLSVMFGITVCLRQEFNPFGDPYTFAITPGIYVLALIINRLCRKGADIFHVWIRKNLEGTVDDDVAAKLAIGEGRQEDLEAERLELQAMNSERFRHRFLEKSRPWILQHLTELLTPRTLQMPGPDGRPNIEYIRDVYHDLMNYGEGMRRPGDRDDISSDDGDGDLRKERQNWTKKPVEGASKAIILDWLGKARKRRTYHKMITGIIKASTQDHCYMCERTEANGAKLQCDLSNEAGTEADPHALDRLIMDFEAENGSSEVDPILWKSYFRGHAKFITRCDRCIDALEQKRLEKLIRAPGAGRATRAGDVSDDELDEEIVFDPMVVSRHSVEGRVMSKWLVAARKRLGGAFPRPDAKEQMERYAMRMRELRAKGGKRRKAPGGDPAAAAAHSAGWEVSLNAASKALLILWLRKALQSKSDKEKQKAVVVREQLKQTLSKIREEDDWFFGAEMRIMGISLTDEGTQILDDQHNLEAEATVKTRKINDDLKTFETEKQEQIDNEKVKFENHAQENRAKTMAQIDTRMQELFKMKKEKELEFAQEEKIAKERDGAPSSKMLSDHRGALKDMDDQREGERQRMVEGLDSKEASERADFEAKMGLIMQAMMNRKRMAQDRISAINKETNAKNRSKENEWQNRTLGWLDRAQRKVTVKEREDAEAAEAERKRKRKR